MGHADRAAPVDTEMCAEVAGQPPWSPGGGARERSPAWRRPQQPRLKVWAALSAAGIDGDRVWPPGGQQSELSVSVIGRQAAGQCRRGGRRLSAVSGRHSTGRKSSRGPASGDHRSGLALTTGSHVCTDDGGRERAPTGLTRHTRGGGEDGFGRSEVVERMDSEEPSWQKGLTRRIRGVA